ncbi:hypothetical protein [Demequina gelatinilytica]|uniref:hypothetical protein n=1 Tax=Demequina gelatinilytica TaxID=1638980 RepID=UPI0007847799|nr:hypothetical protein [Demequina gelatinilytica]
MSNELMESLARGADAGGDLFDSRVSSVVDPARSRVRRARTMRGVGLAGAATVAAVGIAVGASTLGGRGTDVAPADPTPTGTALTANDLRWDTAPRVRGEAGTGQAAVECTFDHVKANPWSDGHSGSVTDDCAALWVGDAPVLEVGEATVEIAGDGAVTVRWTVSNASDTAITVDPAATTLLFGTDPDAVSTGISLVDDATVALGPWSDDTTRHVTMDGDTSPMRLEPGGTFSGTSLLSPDDLDGPGLPSLLDDLTSTTGQATITVQVRIPPAGAVSTSELFLEAETTVHPTGTLDPISPALEGLEARTAGEIRDDAQAALLCHVGDADNPRTSTSREGDDGGPWLTQPLCPTVWVPGGQQLELTRLLFASEPNAGMIPVTWTLTNVSDQALRLDRAAMGIVVEIDGAGWMSSTENTTVGWPAEGDERYGYLSSESDVVTVEPGGTVTGEATLDVGEIEGADRFYVTIRVARDDDENGARELVLETEWEQPPTSAGS